MWVGGCGGGGARVSEFFILWIQILNKKNKKKTKKNKNWGRGAAGVNGACE